MQEIAELGVRGYFAEGWSFPGADMADMRVFLAGRMTFNASLDIEHLVAEFLDCYYGGGVVRNEIPSVFHAHTRARALMLPRQFQFGNG